MYTKEFCEEALKLAMTDGVEVSEAARRAIVLDEDVGKLGSCGGLTGDIAEGSQGKIKPSVEQAQRGGRFQLFRFLYGLRLVRASM